MTDKLPPNLLALFAPRPPLRYLPPSDHAPGDRRSAQISGLAAYLPQLQAPEDPEHPYVPTESWLQRRDRIKQEKREKQERLLTEGVKSYNPATDPQVRGDAYKTLFVARLSYSTSEQDLEREFGRFGPIERIRVVTDTHNENKKQKKPHKGYAFIVYEREKDMKAAYKETDGTRIKDRKVLVDVERGRTVKGWRPRRFGGGLGGRGYTKALPVRPTGPGFAPSGPGFHPGGFRGGFSGRGGFRGGGGFRGRDGFGSRGGVGYQGGGGFSRGPGGFQGGQPPPNAPSGPGGGRYGGGLSGPNGSSNGAAAAAAAAGGPVGGYGGENRRYDERSSFRDRGYGDRDRADRGDRGVTGSNREPIRSRDGGYGGREDRDRDGDREMRDDRRDRDRDRDRRFGGRRDDDHGGRKRYHDGDGYEPESRKRRY
ncbi:MAG: hypothetical protein M1834_005490 [Cirrosporium novae-zelandiae]|nr:MAG: hypothetical protein M1834_005490 [Cirrosporium novae-zelandiae]